MTHKLGLCACLGVTQHGLGAHHIARARPRPYDIYKNHLAHRHVLKPKPWHMAHRLA